MEIRSLHTIIAQNQSANVNNNAEIEGNSSKGDRFTEHLINGLNGVAEAQSNAANLAEAYELGSETDLAKVMVAQQVSSLGFQLTLNVRNKALSAYKDIMNMPV